MRASIFSQFKQIKKLQANLGLTEASKAFYGNYVNIERFVVLNAKRGVKPLT